MTATMPLIGLQVNTAAPSGSLCKNPSARYGMARWTSSTVTPDARGFYMGADTAATTMTYEAVPAVAGQWVGTWYAALATPFAGSYRQVTAYVSFWNSSNVQIGSEVTLRNQVWDGGPPVAVGGSGSNPGAAVAPSGTATARIRYASPAAAGSTSLWVNRIAIRVASTQSAAAATLPSPVWTDVLADSISIETVSGVELSGVEETLQTGSLILKARGVNLDPANGAFRRGAEARLFRAITDSPEIWSGVVEVADATYDDKGKANVTITCLDSARTLADASAGTLPGGTFGQQVAAACYAAGLGVKDSAGNFISASTGVASRDDSATPETWLKRITNTHGGAVYIDAQGTPRALTASDLPTTTAATFSDNPADTGGLKYTDIEVAYGSRSLTNALTIKRINIDEDEDAGKVYGPFIASDSELAYGRSSAEVETVGGVPVDIATRILSTYGNPRRFVSSLTVNARDNLSAVLALKPYDKVRVKRSTLVDDFYRIMSVEHTVTPDSWVTTFTFKPLETTETVDLMVPEMGADTGPGDIAGAGFPRLARRSRSTTQNVTSGTSTVVLWTQELNSEGIAYNASNGRLTVPRNGRYHVTTSLAFPPNATGARVVDVRVNGTNFIRGRVSAWASTDNIVSASQTLRLSAGDYIDVVAAQNSGSTLAIQTDTNATFVSIAYVGP